MAIESYVPNELLSRLVGERMYSVEFVLNNYVQLRFEGQRPVSSLSGDKTGLSRSRVLGGATHLARAPAALEGSWRLKRASRGRHFKDPCCPVAAVTKAGR